MIAFPLVVGSVKVVLKEVVVAPLILLLEACWTCVAASVALVAKIWNPAKNRTCQNSLVNLRKHLPSDLADVDEFVDELTHSV